MINLVWRKDCFAVWRNGPSALAPRLPWMVPMVLSSMQQVVRIYGVVIKTTWMISGNVFTNMVLPLALLWLIRSALPGLFQDMERQDLLLKMVSRLLHCFRYPPMHCGWMKKQLNG